MKDFKLMMVGSDKVFAIENFYNKYLLESGVNLCRFNSYNIFFDYYHRNLFHKMLFKAGLSGVFKKINEQFIHEVQQNRPDVIWVFKGMEIFPASLQWAGNKGIKLLNYNTDNPLIFTGKGSGNQYVTDSIPFYDMHLTYSLGIKKELEDRYGVKVAVLPFGFDDNESLYQNSRRQHEVIKTCFLGNPDPVRAAFIKALAEKGVAIDIYGNNWNKFITNPNITLFPPAYGTEQWKVLYRYRVQLNLMRIHNEDAHNMRSFEVPGIGGIMAAPDTPEHRLYFENGKEAFFYHDVNDCAATIKNLLGMDGIQANKIRLAARKRSKESGYSYEARARQALQYINALMQ